MRLLTPEIAWHDTLPIYTLDFQPQQSFTNLLDEKQPARHPLSSLSEASDVSAPDDKSGKLLTEKKPTWTRLATGGGDNKIRLWKVNLNFYLESRDEKKNDRSTNDQMSFLACLKRHEKPINVVRWSHSGKYLASGSDDSMVLVWAKKSDVSESSSASEKISLDMDEDDKEEVQLVREIWYPVKTLRKHLEDVYDLCWSPDDRGLLTGSVDHSAIIWQVNLQQIPSVSTSSTSQTTVAQSAEDAAQTVPAAASTSQQVHSTNVGSSDYMILRDAKHYIQGCAWDPMNVYVVTQSCDRACRFYQVGNRKCMNTLSKCEKRYLFQDDSWKSFFRRLSFSPDGLLLVCPAGNLETAAFAGPLPQAATKSDSDALDATQIHIPQHAAHVFLRSSLSMPAFSLPTGVQPVITVRFCPQPFRIRRQPDGSNLATVLLPYRWVFCLVLEDSVLLCDTQHPVPFARVSNIHYQSLNDACWSDDGSILMVCSTDGYCSFLYFKREELGLPYHGPIGFAALRNLQEEIKEPSNEESRTRCVDENILIDLTDEISSDQMNGTSAMRVNNRPTTATPAPVIAPMTDRPKTEPKRRLTFVTLASN